MQKLMSASSEHDAGGLCTRREVFLSAPAATPKAVAEVGGHPALSPCYSLRCSLRKRSAQARTSALYFSAVAGHCRLLRCNVCAFKLFWVGREQPNQEKHNDLRKASQSASYHAPDPPTPHFFLACALQTCRATLGVTVASPCAPYPTTRMGDPGAILQTTALKISSVRASLWSKAGRCSKSCTVDTCGSQDVLWLTLYMAFTRFRRAARRLVRIDRGPMKAAVLYFGPVSELEQ